MSVSGIGSMLDTQLARTEKLAITPLIASLSKTRNYILRNISEFNPLTAIVKAFNDSVKMQEKALSMGISLNNLGSEIQKSRAQGHIRLSTLEARKSLLENLDYGIRVNTGELLGMHEQFRVTRQNENSLRDSMLLLSVNSKNSDIVQREILKHTEILNREYLVSEEKLLNAVTAMNSDVVGIGALTSQTEEFAKVSQLIAAAGNGGLSKSAIENIGTLLLSQEHSVAQTRLILGIRDESIEFLKGGSSDLEKVAKVKEIIGETSKKFDDITGKNKYSKDLHEMVVINSLNSFGNNFKKYMFSMNELNNKMGETSKGLEGDNIRVKRENTLRAEQEKAKAEFQEFILANLDNIVPKISTIGNIFTKIITLMADSPLVDYLTGNALSNLRSIMGNMGAKSLTSKSSSEDLVAYVNQVSSNIKGRGVSVTAEEATNFLKEAEEKGIDFSKYIAKYYEDDRGRYFSEMFQLSMNTVFFIPSNNYFVGTTPRKSLELELINNLKNKKMIDHGGGFDQENFMRDSRDKFDLSDDNIIDIFKSIDIDELQAIRGTKPAFESMVLKSSILNKFKKLKDKSNTDDEDLINYIAPLVGELKGIFKGDFEKVLKDLGVLDAVVRLGDSKTVPGGLHRAIGGGL